MGESKHRRAEFEAAESNAQQAYSKKTSLKASQSKYLQKRKQNIDKTRQDCNSSSRHFEKSRGAKFHLFIGAPPLDEHNHELHIFHGFGEIAQI